MHMTTHQFIAQYQTIFLNLEHFSRQYSSWLLALASAGIMLLMWMRISKRKKVKVRTVVENKPTQVITSQDIKAIAGEDIMATQLDLARAYIEMGKKNLAKKILEHVVAHGDQEQKQSAHVLMSHLK